MGRDRVRAAIDRIFAREEYNWAEPAGPWEWIRRQFLALVAWFDHLESTNPTLFTALLAVMITILVVLVVHLGVVAFHAATARIELGDAAPLAPSPRVTPEALEQEAEAMARAGRYADAVGVIFHAMLVTLQSRDAVRYHPSKTPAEYVREARLHDSGVSALSDLVRRLYGHLFAGEQCSQVDWERFRDLARSVPEYVAAH